jgi:hypothetical protein
MLRVLMRATRSSMPTWSMVGLVRGWELLRCIETFVAIPRGVLP